MPFRNHSSAKAYAHKFVPVDGPIAIEIKLLNHSHHLLLLQSLSKLSRDSPQILNIDSSLALSIEQIKSAQYLISRISGKVFLRSNGHESVVRKDKPSGTTKSRFVVIPRLLRLRGCT